MYDYPKPISMNNFIIGNGASIDLYNPLSRNVTLQILQESTNAVLGTYSGTSSGIINSEFKTDESGIVITPVKLESGNYKIVEVKSPN